MNYALDFLLAVLIGSFVALFGGGCRSQGNGQVLIGYANYNITTPRAGKTVATTDGTNALYETSGSVNIIGGNTQSTPGDDSGNSPSLPVSLTK